MSFVAIIFKSIAMLFQYFIFPEGLVASLLEICFYKLHVGSRGISVPNYIAPDKVLGTIYSRINSSVYMTDRVPY